MSPFSLYTLALPAAAIFLMTLIVSYQATKMPLISIFVAFIKVGIFAAYFGFAFDGTYSALDDWTYLDGGEKLLNDRVGITNLAENWELVLAIGGGQHFLYYLYNAYALRFFGEGYFAPVALNLLVTVVIAFCGMRLAIVEFGFKKQASRLFFLFLLLHPDILAWSNVINGKDVLILLLHVILLTASSIYLRGQIQKALRLAIPAVFVLFNLRFYVPILFAMALIVGAMLTKQRGQLWYLLISVAFASLLIVRLGEAGLGNAFIALQENWVNPVYGLMRMILTPIPFNTEISYQFLNFPALIHWLLIPFVIFGLQKVWKMRTPFSRFMVAYLIVFSGLYAVYGELQGPRHRVQMDFALALLQFIGAMAVMRKFARSSDYRMPKSASV
jgi:hypothetical protein